MMGPDTTSVKRDSASNEVEHGFGAAERVHRRSWLERVTIAHVAILAIASTWAFGGNADWVRTPLSWWASLGLLITAAAIGARRSRRDGSLRPLKWVWPLAAFNALVIAGVFNPSFRAMISEGETLYVNTGSRAGWPSAALPGHALRALWQFDALWIAGFNLVLVVLQRRGLRRLLLVLMVNALVLAVFGTVQKLSGARGLFFDAVASPQKSFFATFIYHNHWGAFTILMLAAGLGLTWHYARRRHARDFFHSPAFLGLTALGLLSLTLPLSTSRSCTIIATVLILGAGGHWLTLLLRKRRHYRESIGAPLVGAAIAVLLAVGGIWYFARDTIALRVEKTREQVADIQARGNLGARAVLYADTWRMARDRPWFGWGMASYPHVFTLYNRRESVDRLPVFYHDAHSDWLQSLAEHGFVGTALLGLCGLVPLLSVRAKSLRSNIARYLLAGCALVLLYAWVEFPFGNTAVVLYWWLSFFAALQYARLAERTSPAA